MRICSIEKVSIRVMRAAEVWQGAGHSHGEKLKNGGSSYQEQRVGPAAMAFLLQMWLEVPTAAHRGLFGRPAAYGRKGFVRSLFTALFGALTSIPFTGAGLSRFTYWNVPNG